MRRLRLPPASWFLASLSLGLFIPKTHQGPQRVSCGPLGRQKSARFPDDIMCRSGHVAGSGAMLGTQDD